MSLMPKYSATLLLSVSLFGAGDADVIAFLKNGIGNNPNVSDLQLEISGKKPLPGTGGWQAYFVSIDANVKQGSDKRHITQNGTYFVNGDLIATELVNLKTGERYNDTVAPEFSETFYTKANRISGDVNATYKVAIFSDPLCPFCRRYVPEAVAHMAKYPKTFAVYYYHLPLASLHPAAVALTKAAIAAEQNGADEAVIKMYAVEINVNETDEQKILDAYNKAAGTKVTVAELRRPSVLKQFEFDQKVSRTLGVNGTPTVYFNGQKDSTKNKYKEVKVK